MTPRPLYALLLGATLSAGCSGGTVTPTDLELPGTLGEPPVANPAPPPTSSAPARDSVWDVAERGVPRVVTADYIDLDSIARVSYFRSSFGHDYKDAFESCRSMKHYFVPKNFQNAAAITVRAPLAGEVTRAYQEWAGWQLHIRSDSVPAVTVILFHVALSRPIAIGDRLAAGQSIGTHVGSMTASDVAVSVTEKKGFRLVSYFEAMTDEVFARYAARGVPSRESAIISREQRDADPIPCDGEAFVGTANLPQWVQLN